MKAKNAVASRARTKKVLKASRGYWGERSKKFRRAIETRRRALAYAFRDRHNRKREFRALWITRINAAARENGLLYRQIINGMKQKNIIISRDILAKIAAEYPQVFTKLARTVMDGITVK